MASPAALAEIDGVGDATVVVIKTVQAAAHLMQREGNPGEARPLLVEIGAELLPFGDGP